MSKSLGNFVTIHELLRTDAFGNSTWPGDTLRLAMLRTHYRDPIDWTVKELERAQQELREWYTAIKDQPLSNQAIDDGVVEALSDDLNTHAAIARLQELRGRQELTALRASLEFLGFSCNPANLARKVFMSATSGNKISGRAVITERADGAHFRVIITERVDGAHFDDPSTQKRVEELIALRQSARAAKNFVEADRIRDQLAELGVVLKDSKDGTTWEFKR
jgi:cysteinyl-tRNA synthetase